MQVEWTPEAKQDVWKLREHYRFKNPVAGKKIYLKVRAKAESLVDQPRMGKKGRVRDTFETKVVGTPYTLVYELLPDNEKPEIISIMRVISGRQQYMKS